MSDLVDGTTVPWHAVSGALETCASKIPPPVRREQQTQPVRDLSARVAATAMAEAGKAVDVEISKFKTAMTTVGTAVAAHALEQLESRRRWFRTVTESLKEHR